MKEFRIDEISFVDRPAQAGAMAVLAKRDDIPDKADPVAKLFLQLFSSGAITEHSVQKYNENHGSDGRFSSGSGGGSSGDAPIEAHGAGGRGTGGTRNLTSHASHGEIRRYDQGADPGYRFKDHIKQFEQAHGIGNHSSREDIARALIAESDDMGGDDRRGWRDTAAHHYGFRDHQHVEQFDSPVGKADDEEHGGDTDMNRNDIILLLDQEYSKHQNTLDEAYEKAMARLDRIQGTQSAQGTDGQDEYDSGLDPSDPRDGLDEETDMSAVDMSDPYGQYGADGATNKDDPTGDGDPEDQQDQGADEQEEGDSQDQQDATGPSRGAYQHQHYGDRPEPIGGRVNYNPHDPQLVGRLRDMFGNKQGIPPRVSRPMARDLVDQAQNPDPRVEDIAQKLMQSNPRIGPATARMMGQARVASKAGFYGKAYCKSTGLSSTYGGSDYPETGGGRSYYRPDGDGTNDTEDDPGYGPGLTTTAGTRSGLSREYDRRRIDDLVRSLRSRDRMLSATDALRQVRVDYPELF